MTAASAPLAAPLPQPPGAGAAPTRVVRPARRADAERATARAAERAAHAAPVAEESAARSEAVPVWLAFVNTDDQRRTAERRDHDVLLDFDAFVAWLQEQQVLDAERAGGILRRAFQQPAGAAASLVDARRVRAALRGLAERGASTPRARADAVAEINRVLGRSAGTRRLEERADGAYARAFVAGGDAFAALVLPIAESAADTLVAGSLPRVRRCADPRCARVFLDTTKNGRRRWCDMATCGNRAKAARHRSRTRTAPGERPPMR